MQKIVSQLDGNGRFVGPVVADRSPMDDDEVFLIPGGAVDAPPPDVPEGKIARWNGIEFEFEDIPPPPPPPEILPNVADVIVDPVDKLRAFLAANPDVAAIL